MSEGRLVSPDEMVKAAKDMCLDGREPKTEIDYQIIANFCAANIGGGAEEPVLRLIGMIYDWPISSEHLTKIAAFQALKKREGKI